MSKRSKENLETIKEELDIALCDSDDAPSYLIVEIVMNILDTAEIYGRLNSAERKLACDYVTRKYGYDF